MASASRHRLSVTDGRQAVVLRAAIYARHAPIGALAKGLPVVTGPGCHTHGPANLICGRCTISMAKVLRFFALQYS